MAKRSSISKAAVAFIGSLPSESLRRLCVLCSPCVLPICPASELSCETVCRFVLGLGWSNRQEGDTMQDQLAIDLLRIWICRHDRIERERVDHFGLFGRGSADQIGPKPRGLQTEA